MAEFAASILTLAGAAAKLADTLRIAVSKIRSAESESRAISADTLCFSLYLTQVSRLVEDLDGSQTKELHDILANLVPACNALVNKLERLIGPPLPFGAKRLFVLQWSKIYYKWIMNGPDVAFVRELIGSFKSTLGLVLTTMTLAVAIQQHCPPDVCADLKGQVQSSIGFAQEAQMNLLHFTDFDTVDKRSAFIITERPCSTTDSDVSTIEQASHPSSPSGVMVTLNTQTENGALDRILDDSDFEDSDFCVQDLDDERTQILKVQAKTIQCANAMLEASPKPSWTWRSGVNSPLQDSASVHKNPVLINPDAALGSTPPSSFGESPNAYPDDADREHRISDSISKGTEGSQSTRLSDTVDVAPKNDSHGVSRSELEELIKEITERTLRTSGSLTSSIRDEQSSHPPRDMPLPAQDTDLEEEGVRSQRNEVRQDEIRDDAMWDESRDRRGGISRLERLMLAERDESIRREAMAEAERKAQSANAEKLKNLENLLIAQNDEQKRKQALEEDRHARENADKKAAAEAAEKLLKAAKNAREEAEMRAQKEAQEVKEAHENALREAKAAAEELEKAKIAAEAEAAELKPKLVQLPIKFEDASGRTFTFPWNSCNTWAGIEELIKQAFLHDEVNGPLVQKGQYELLGSDGNIILPPVWESSVLPDSTVTMRMRSELGEGVVRRKQGWARLGLDRKWS